MSFISLQKRNVSFSYHPPLRIQMGTRRDLDESLPIAFRYLPYKDLRKCMLVSKTWRKLVLEELQARCIVNITHTSHAKQIIQQFRTCPHFRIGKCVISDTGVDNLQIQQMLFLAKNTLQFLKLECINDVDESLLFKLLNNLENLTHLTVTMKSASINSPFSENQKLHSKFPVLSGHEKHALLQNHIQRNDSHEQKSEQDWNEGNLHDRKVTRYKNILHLQIDFGHSVTFQLSKVFQVFPNLVELAIANIVEEPRRHFKNASLLPYDDHDSNLKLKHLSLRQYSNPSFSEKLVRTLMKLNLQLESFVLIFHPPNKTLQVLSSLLRQFIESQGGSLQSLKLAQVEDDLCHFSDSSNTQHDDPHMRTISSPVGCNTYYYWNFNYSSPSVSLLPLKLPNLRIFHVQKPLITNLAQVLNHYSSLNELSLQVSCGSNWQGMLPSKLEPHEGITRLKIDFIDSESLSRLGYCFPALKTLQLSFCDKNLFDVLCNLIPYFSGNSNFVSCQQCHGTSEEFSAVRGKGETMSRKDSGVDPDKMRSCSVSYARSNNTNEGLYETPKADPWKKYRFKNLTLLTVRPCHHHQFEKFVFLQGESYNNDRDINQNSVFDKVCFGGTIGTESCRNGFSWSDPVIMNDGFAEFSVDTSENECSSA